MEGEAPTQLKPGCCPSSSPPQMAQAGRSFTALQRGAAIVRNGAKLFVVGTSASFIGTGLTNGLIAARRYFDPSIAKGTEDMNLVTQVR